jgi:hypothetical protein
MRRRGEAVAKVSIRVMMSSTETYFVVGLSPKTGLQWTLQKTAHSVGALLLDEYQLGGKKSSSPQS